MLNPSTPLKARRVYDGTVTDDALARWKPVTTGQPSTIQVAFIPSAAHAYALHLLRQDLIANPGFLGVGYPTFHIDRGVNRLPINEPTRFPRYLIVVGGTTEFGNSLGDALVATVAPLVPLGVTVTYGASDGSAGPTFRPHSAIVPVASYSTQSFATSAGGSLDGRYDIVGEDANYDGGDVFVACVQGSADFGDVFFDNLGDGIPAYGIASNDPTLTISGYSVVETVAGGRLFANNTIAAYDAAAAVPHQARFRRFQQHYYFPSGPIGAYGFTTDFAGLFAIIASGYTGTSFPAGDSTSLAAQIIADAVSHFT